MRISNSLSQVSTRCVVWLLLGLSFVAATLCGCRVNRVPYATAKDVIPEPVETTRPSLPSVPAEEGLPPELEAHLLPTSEAETLARIAEALGESVDEISRVATQYRVAPGDVLTISVLMHPDLSREALVAPDGTIGLAMVGTISVGGKTIPAIEQEIATRLAEFIENPRVNVFLKSSGTRRVTVIGMLPRAGQVDLVGQETLLEVLTQAGLQRAAGLSQKVELIRRGRRAVIDLAKIYSLDAAGFNIRLKPNDIVMLLEPLPISVVGAVSKPGPVAQDEKGYCSIVEAITRAGSFTERADIRKAQIIRRGGKTEELDLNSILFASTPQPAPLLYPGDTLLIPESRDIGVYVLGMVTRPGLVRGKPPMNLMQALALAGPERFGAVLSEAKVVRGFPSKPKVLSIDIGRLLYGGDLSQNVVLAEGDVVFVPESAASDVIDFLNRVLGPITGAARARVEYVVGQEAWERLDEEK